jgi:SAM-dependent methyltransferase
MENESTGIFTNFGRNWRLYHDRFFDDAKTENARRCLLDFHDGNLVAGKRFLDVGGGSGLHSLAAYELGAAEVVTFDNDTNSVECCREFWQRKGRPDNWKVVLGSILDREFVSSLGKFDFVYAWGVLHHTGNLWGALENAIKLVEDNGYFHLAIYNEIKMIGLSPDGRFAPSSLWLPIKRFYSRQSEFWQNIIDYLVISGLITGYLLTFTNPRRRINEHQNNRGASWRVDIKDWLSGYPYECARPESIFRYLFSHGFTLINLKTYDGLGNNEFLFQKIGGASSLEP